MTINEYQKLTHSTAQYPKDQALAYLTLGLLGEVSETESIFDLETFCLDSYISEVSDVCWYISELCNFLNFKMEEIFSLAEDYDYDQDVDVVSIANVVKKVIRDSNGTPTEEQKSKIKARLVFAALFVNEHVEEIKYQDPAHDLEYIFDYNIKKLKDRKERGVIKGDGGNR